MANSKKTIFHAYAIVPLLAICAIHAIVWLGTKSLADFSRASDVTLGIDALFPLRPEWVVIYVATFLFWGMGLLLIARQDEQLCCRFAAGVVIGDLICGIIFIAFPSCIPRPELNPADGGFIWALSVVYSFDTPTNCFPSMHCMFAYLVFRQSLRTPGARPWFKLFCGVFTVLVCLSTLLVKQHVFADVIGAFSSASYPSLWDKNCLCGKFLLKSIKNSCNLLRDVV